MQATSRSSSTVCERLTSNRWRIDAGSALRSTCAVVMFMVLKRGTVRRHAPHTSSTGVVRRISVLSMSDSSSHKAIPCMSGWCFGQ